MKKLLLFIICIFFLTGCYDYKELDNIDIITSIGVDYENNEYKVTFEIIKPSSKEENENDKTILISSSDAVFSKAFENNYNLMDKEAYFSHLQLLLLSDNLLKEKGTQEIFDFLLRTSRIGNTFNTVVAKDSSSYDMLNNKQNKNTVANKITELLKNNSNYSIISNNNQFDSLISTILSKGIDIYLPSVVMDNNDFLSSDIAIFNGYYMCDYINKEYSTILNLATNKLNRILYLNDGINAIDINNSSNKYIINKDNIKITINYEGTIKSIDPKYSLKDNNTFDSFNDIFNKVIEDDLYKLIDILRNNNSDVLGIGNKYYKKYPRLYNDNIFKNIDCDIEINSNINKFGIIFEVIN